MIVRSGKMPSEASEHPIHGLLCRLVINNNTGFIRIGL